MKTARNVSGSITARWGWAFGIATLASVVSWTASSQATVNTLAWYQLGESDPGASANALGQNPTVDSSGNGFNLTRVGSPTNRSDVAVESSILGSTLSMQFNGSASYATNVSVTTLTTNVGMEVWAKPLGVPASGVLGGAIYNGNSYGIELTSATNWEVRIGGVGVFGAQPAALNQWHHLGLVLTDAGGVNRLSRFYYDGVQVASLTSFVFSPTNSPNFAIGSLFGSSHFLNGLLDNARVFTFTGAFDPHDFLIPEPSSVSLLVLGGGMTLCAIRRRRGQKQK